MMKVFPHVDVIVVNYNGRRLLGACLDALFATDYPAFHVRVVDNGSTDGSAQMVAETYPKADIVRNSGNLGFGKANDIGIRRGDSPFFALLNSDTVVTRGWLLPLVDVLLADASVAAACSKLLFLDDPRFINGIGGGMNRMGFGYDIGMFQPDREMPAKASEVFFPCAAACLMRRSAFEEAGGFDERFFMYHEDVDLGWRLRLLGYRIVAVPASVVHHAFGGTTKASGGMALRNELGLRHALRSLLKNYSMASLARTLPIFLLLGATSSARERSALFLRCLLWNMKQLPDTCRERARIQRTRRASDAAVGAFMWKEAQVPVRFPRYELVGSRAFAESGERRCFLYFSAESARGLGYGWGGIEVSPEDERIRFRRFESEAVFFLWNPHGRGILHLEVLLPPRGTLGPAPLLVSINRESPIEPAIPEGDDRGWRRISVPYDGPAGPLEVRLVAGAPRPPHGGCRDGRAFGIGLKMAECAPAPEDALALDGISVIIPTYNRASTLLRTLKAIRDQSLSPSAFEVIVVDDGSTDSTEEDVRGVMKSDGLNIRYYFQENRKQGAARNLGLKNATMPIVMFLGDDIIPERTFLEEHLKAQRARGCCGDTAVIGYTTWPKDMRVTPFMRYVGEYGPQFGFSLIRSPEEALSFAFFYASNVSLPRALLDKVEYAFDEEFESYGWEDVELGYRLERAGMRLLFCPKAVACHYHPMRTGVFLKRYADAGAVPKALFLRKHPELGWFLGEMPGRVRGALCFLLSLAAQRFLDVVDSSLFLPLPQIIYKIAIRASDHSRQPSQSNTP